MAEVISSPMIVSTFLYPIFWQSILVVNSVIIMLVIKLKNREQEVDLNLLKGLVKVMEMLVVEVELGMLVLVAEAVEYNMQGNFMVLCMSLGCMEVLVAMEYITVICRN